MTQHTVKQGEHISALAHQYNFFDYHLIWDDSANADLKAARDNPHVLHPGDVVTIPDKKEKTVNAADATVHTFQVKQSKLLLRIAIKDYFSDPIANASCVLEVEGVPKSETTTDAGLIERQIAATDIKGRLVIMGSDLAVQIGNLDPVDKKTGQVARFNNLGYAAGPLGDVDTDLLKSAVEEFQCDQNIRDGAGKVTGVCDARTQAKLKEIHGS